MDNQFRNNLRCQIEGCNNVALGIFNNKWTCGLCIVRAEQKMKQFRQKFYDLIEQEISNEKNN